MSSTYANVTVVGAGQDEIVAALGTTRAFVSETVEGATVVFAAVDEEAYAFGEGLTAAALSADCRCSALEVSVFEEQVFQYRLFRDGQEVSVGIVGTALARQMAEQAGGSLPEPDAATLVNDLGRGDEALLHRALSPDTDHTFASERHAALAGALGLPAFAAGRGYRETALAPEASGVPLTPVGEVDEPEAADDDQDDE